MDVTLAALQVVEDPIHIPSRHLYILDGKIWHDLHFAHAELSAKGGLTKDRKTWLMCCKACWAQLDQASAMLKTNDDRLKRDVRSVCDTVGLFAVLVAAIDKSRTLTLAALAEKRIRQACILPHDPTFLIGGAELSHGMVIDSCAWEHVAGTIRHGRPPIISKNCMYSCRDTCAQAPARGDWQSASREGRGRPWSEVAVPLVDVCTIAFLSRSYRISRH